MLRDIWVECCCHLSMFICNGVQYESCPDTELFWGKPSKNMKYKLKDVVGVGDTFSYEYDFGSTTRLVLSVNSCIEREKHNNKIVILSRNNPPKIICNSCEENEARWVNPFGYNNGTAFWCKDCLKKAHDKENDEFSDEEGYLLPICNSPRMGVCGYEGRV